MTRRPRRVTGSAAPGLAGVPLIPGILLADPDPAAHAMLRDALLEGVGPCDLQAAHSSDELARHLEHGDPPPSLILVHHDLPDRGAREAVRSIKCDPQLRRTPVVVLARQLAPEQVEDLYDAGANTVIAQPVTFLALVRLMKVFTAYWLDAAELPDHST